MSDYLEMIREKRAAIASRITAITQELNACRAEDARLANAESVIGELTAKHEQIAVEAKENGDPVATNVKRIPPSRAKGLPRPNGAPKTAAMVTEVLRSHWHNERRGATSAEILDAVRRRWWPGAVLNDLMPTVYRHMKKGELFEKDGDQFHLKVGREMANALFSEAEDRAHAAI